MIRTLTPALLGSLLCAASLPAQSKIDVKEIQETIQKALEKIGQGHATKQKQGKQVKQGKADKSHRSIEIDADDILELGEGQHAVVRIRGKDGKEKHLRVLLGKPGKQGKVHKVIELGDIGVEIKGLDVGKILQDKEHHILKLGDSKDGHAIIELKELGEGKALQDKGHHILKLGDGKDGHAIIELKELDVGKLERLHDLKLGDHDIRIIRGSQDEKQDKKSVRVSKSLRISIGDEGVRVEVEENGKTKKYTADTIEGLLRKHPELRGRISGWSVKRSRRAAPERARVGKRRVEGDREFEALNREIETLRKRMERLRRELDREIAGVSKKKAAEARKPRSARRLNPIREREEEIEEHEAERPILGVTVRAFSNDIRSFLGLPNGVGLMIDEVMDGSTAAKVGLRSGDLVVKINGKWIKKPSDVAGALRASKKGTSVDYYRKGQKRHGSSK